MASKPTREIFGFALGSTLTDPSVGFTTWNFSLISTVAFFGLHVNDDGTWTGDSDWTVWNSQAQPAFVNYAHSYGTRVLLTVVMQDFSTGTPHMCSALAHSASTIGYAVAQAEAQRIDGLNIDYEGLNGSCGTSDPNWARHAFTSFITSLRTALPSNYILSVDTYASSATDPVGFYDVQSLAPSVDSIFVMAYDLEYANYARSPLGCWTFCLGPTAPLTGYYYNDTSAAQQYVSAIGASKVILGVPYYGRKACVGTPGTNPYPSPSNSVAADGYLDASGEESYYEVKAGSYVAGRDPNDRPGLERLDYWYNTTLNCTRELYWDDAVSLGQKYDLVNQDNLRGVGIWTLNYGGPSPELWNALSTHFGLMPTAPGSVAACAGASSVTVSWTPATSRGGAITSYVVTASPGGATVTVPATVTAATLTGLAVGTTYTLTVQAVNSSGAGIGTTSNAVTPVAALQYVGYFSWFDAASPGMNADNIHLFNPGTTTSYGCVYFSGRMAAPWGLAAGQEWHMSFPPGWMGGPITVWVQAGSPVLASQRVQYYQSFNEVWAMTRADAATTSYLNWFDKASPGMTADNIHILNPGGATANVTVSLPGASAVSVAVGPGDGTYVTFPAGRIGGPVRITSDQPVLASQRVQYYQSFNEVVARGAAQASTKTFFNWFDRVTPGMQADNVHVLNPGSTSASVTVSMPGAAAVTATVAPGTESVLTFPAGHFGGPLTVTSSQPVLATQRVVYYQSFNEVGSEAATQALTTSHVMWFDRASPGMNADNIHVLNPGSVVAHVTVALPGASPVSMTLAPGAEGYATFPTGRLGGPVTISSDQPVLAAQRIEYYQSFNEVPAE